MSDASDENISHFPPEFILRAWAPDPTVRKVWVWDRVGWSENNRRDLPTEAQRGTVGLRSLDGVCAVLSGAHDNSRWNRALENDSAPIVSRLRSWAPARLDAGVRAASLESLGVGSETLGHVIFSSVVRVQGHPPAFGSEAKARWYLQQLESPALKQELSQRLFRDRRVLLVVISPESPRLAISDWATVTLRTREGELLVLPVSPSHALCAAPRSIPAAIVEQLLSALPLADVTEAVYGTQICLWPRKGEDLTDPVQKIAAAERVRDNMMRWRPMLPLRATLQLGPDEPS